MKTNGRTKARPGDSGCASPELNLVPAPVDFAAHDTIDGVMEMIVLIARALALSCRGHQESVLENLAL